MPRKNSEAAQEKVHKAMEEKKEGTLRSGRSGKKVTSNKQAIAIGLSEARAEGKKAPARKSSPKKTAEKKSTKKSAAKKSTAKKTAAKKTTAPKKAAAKKSTAKKSAS